MRIDKIDTLAHTCAEGLRYKPVNNWTPEDDKWAKALGLNKEDVRKEQEGK